MPRQRPEPPVVHVVLARPHHLDGPADLLGQHHRVDNEVDVAIAATAETAAHQKVMQLHLLARNAEQLCRRFRRRGLALRAGPDFDGITSRCDGGDCVQRLHLRMVGIVAAIFAFDHIGRVLECATGIALCAPVACRTRKVLRIGREGFDSLVAVKPPGHAGSGPSDRPDQRLPRCECCPRCLRHYANTVRQPDDCCDAGHRLGLFVRDPVRDRSFNRRPHHRAVQHTRHLHVDAVCSTAIDFGRQFDTQHVLADESEIGRLLELIGLDVRSLGGQFCESGYVAIGQPAA